VFRTPYVHLQEEYIALALLYDMFPMRFCKQSIWLKEYRAHPSTW